MEIINCYKQLESIKNNFCIGCGICSLYGLEVFLDDYGKYQAKGESKNERDCINILKNCPFSSYSMNEDELASLFFKDKSMHNRYLGTYLSNYIGHVTNDNYRLRSSSGGIITWLLLNLLKEKKITEAVFVGESEDKNVLFEYKISSNEQEIIDGASSKYYPVELSKVLSKIEKNIGEYAIVALPCFTKGIRYLQMQNDVFKDRIKFIISPVCGHLKSKHYADFLTWQKGLNPYNIANINFRKKYIDLPASQYGTEFKIKEAKRIITYAFKNESFDMALNWGHGMFKYPACDYCDDIFGELSDISVGDAWLKDYMSDYKGNSIIIIRNNVFQKLLKKGLANRDLFLNEVNTDTIIASQLGGIRNKREDLTYRLYLKAKNKEWYPPKRVKSSNKNINLKRKRIIKQRMKICFLSHEMFHIAKKQKDLNIFISRLSPEIIKYKLLYTNKFQRALKIIKYLFNKTLINK
ncbi:MAG: Coenzyme F420 hydrogenase/dehydrogenase, beta subunit C-terminal domain [Bacteroidales bacterium]|nr:Coenzyme F420 hydrogenase/dehydrogenase, beta subunit C-terminal domain [Bacteroidales bacterium]